MQKNQTWINKYLDSKQLKNIENATKEAELKTSGEIVPMIVHSSGYYDHVLPLLTLSLLLLFLLIELLIPYSIFKLENIYLNLLGIMATSYFLAFLLTKFSFIKRVFTTKETLDQQVHDRAFKEFYLSQLSHTEDKTGILLFASLVEKKVIVLADEGISKHVNQNYWNDVIALILKGIKEKDFEQGFIQGIKKCGDLLSSHCPRKEDDIDELENHLIIKE